MIKAKYGILLMIAFIGLGLALFSAFKDKQRYKTTASSPSLPEQSAENTGPVKTYCQRQVFENKSYIVCRANPAQDDIRLFLYDGRSKPYKYFRAISKELARHGKQLAFAMNGGMYHADYSAVGLYVEDGKEYHAVATSDGPGNFHMKPNGIFYLAKGKAGVMETQAYLASAIRPAFATQSGPMLVINNRVHPRFIANSPYLEWRNGVGVTQQGEAFFVISEQRVNFDELARFFRDVLQTPNALYLDGSISSLYAPEMRRADWLRALGPIIGVTLPKQDMVPMQKTTNVH